MPVSTILLDGAHNPDGAEALADAMAELAAVLPQGRTTLLLAVMADKAVDDILAALARCPSLRESRVVATTVPDTDRSLPAADLATAWAACTGQATGGTVPDCDVALDHALDLAAEAGGPLLITGSLYLIGHVRSRLVADDPAWR